MGRRYKKWHEVTENKELYVLAAPRIAISGNFMLRGAKSSVIEVVAPKEEEESRISVIKYNNVDNIVKTMLKRFWLKFEDFIVRAFIRMQIRNLEL